MRHHRTAIALAIAAGIAAACATERQTQTAIGAGAGAAAGAVVGSAVSGSGRGTAVGAAIGAGVGAAAGYNWDLIKEKLGIATKDSKVELSEQQDGGLKLNVPGTVSFASGSATLNPGLHGTLDRIATTLNEHSDTTLKIVGHTDAMGDAQSNLELSRKRAAAVADYLAQRGVQRSRISVEGHGQNEPIADNATEAGRSQNRRVEMLIRPPKS